MPAGRSDTALIADIGGTNVRFALVKGGGPSHVLAMRTGDFPGPAEAVRAYLTAISADARPRRAAFAVASPVVDDTVRLTNRAWTFSIRELGRTLGLDHLEVVNDFAAIALALPHLTAADLAPLGIAADSAPASLEAERLPVAVLGPGTGLGVSGLLPSAAGWVPVPSEGGHVSLAAADARQEAVIATLRRSFGHVSAERVLSGPGLVNLYAALAEVEDRPAETLQPADVTRRARDGSCPLCREALLLFTRFLGAVAGDLALTLGASGGVYVAGGVVPRLGPEFDAGAFREGFLAKGRFRSYLEPVPTWLVTRDLPAFLGLAALVHSPD